MTELCATADLVLHRRLHTARPRPQPLPAAPAVLSAIALPAAATAALLVPLQHLHPRRSCRPPCPPPWPWRSWRRRDEMVMPPDSCRSGVGTRGRCAAGTPDPGCKEFVRTSAAGVKIPYGSRSADGRGATVWCGAPIGA
ncbi:hypothetical protein ACFQZK_17485 [Rhodococcus aetherivorans]